MMMAEAPETTTNAILSALSTLNPSHLSDLIHSILTHNHRQHCRLSSLLSSPTLFSLTLHHLHSLNLSGKTQLIARHLLYSLRNLTCHFHSHLGAQLQPTPMSTSIRDRELDAILLLLLLCEAHQNCPEALQAPYSDWRGILSNIYCCNILRFSSSAGFIYGAGCHGVVLIPYMEMIGRCLRFVRAMDPSNHGGDHKEGREVAASVAAVVALLSVEVEGVGMECVICKEEMKQGRDVCELPCQHLFHWMCILPWLRKKNTCPCCRFQLPSDDVYQEIQRLWQILVKMGEKFVNNQFINFQ